MGTRYTQTVISGFNASPPSDDGSAGADNQITWAKHLDKLGTPLKNAIESMDSKLVTDLNTEARSITSNDSAVAGDNKKTIEIASTVSTSVVTLSLGDAASMANGYMVRVVNRSAYTQTISRVTTSDGISGTATNVAIPALHSMGFAVNSGADGYNIVSTGSLSPSCAFFAYNSANDANQTGNAATATVDFDTVVTNIGGCFALGTFTPKYKGTYFLHTQVRISDTTLGMSTFTLNIVTTARTYRNRQMINLENIGDEVTLNLTVPAADMSAGDTATVTLLITGGVGDSADIDGSATVVTFFSGFLLP